MAIVEMLFICSLLGSIAQIASANKKEICTPGSADFDEIGALPIRSEELPPDHW
jgi:hypothetical protein